MVGATIVLGLSYRLLIAGIVSIMMVLVYESEKFRSYEKEKKWEIVFDLIPTRVGLINQSYFITKRIGRFRRRKMKNLIFFIYSRHEKEI